VTRSASRLAASVLATVLVTVAGALAAPGALAGSATGAATGAAAGSATGGGAGSVPTVGMRPLHPAAHGPDGGQWFVLTLGPGQAAGRQAVLTNTAPVPQTVTLYAENLAFAANGTPQITTTTVPSDVGQWTTVHPSSLVIPARSTRVVGFRVLVPRAATPGDHIGVLVAQSAPQVVNGERVIDRIATRIYVTVPGVATRGMALAEFTHTVHSPFWPRSVAVLATLRNTGRIALAPTVLLDGHRAAGSGELVAESVEDYSATVHLSWWGGHVRLSVVASAPGVSTRSRSVSLWVVNWVVVAAGLAGLVGLSVLGVVAGQWLRRTRAGRRALQARLAELESRVAAASEQSP
jgi:hypothetical protein